MLVLYAVHGLPYEEIAAVTGCNVGTVKSRMSRARTALKAMLFDDEREEAPGTDAVARVSTKCPTSVNRLSQ
jgi:RNA polymerase sigma-70 factor (ECF subfamily)